MDRRSFIGSILTACVAPAIVRADSLMRVVPTGMTILKPMQPGLSTMFKGHPLFKDLAGHGFTGVMGGQHYINGHFWAPVGVGSPIFIPASQYLDLKGSR